MARNRKAAAKKTINPFKTIRDEFASLLECLQPELPIGRHILVLAKSVWVRYPKHWWRIHLVAADDYVDHPFGLPVNSTYLVRHLGLLQDAANSVLCRGAEMFDIDYRPMTLSAALCQTHFRSVDPRAPRILEDDDTWWPHCLMTGPTALSIDQQREAYDGEKRVAAIIAMARREKEESFVLPNGIRASKFVLPLAAIQGRRDEEGRLKAPPPPPDPFAEPRELARHLPKVCRKIVETLCDHGGALPLPELAKVLDWSQDRTSGNFQSRRTDINQKFRKSQWRLERESNEARLKDIRKKP